MENLLLTVDWYKKKTKQIQQQMSIENLDALILLDPFNIYYAIGFFHQSTERPLGVVIPQNGEPKFYVPKLEKEMAEETWVSEVNIYFDYPGITHPIVWMLKENKQYKRIGFDKLDYRQWRIATGENPNVIVTDLVYTMRLVKEAEEIRLIEKAGIYADLLVEKTREAIVNGLSELDAYNYADSFTVQKMKEDLGELVMANQGLTNGAVLYGPHSAYPHGLMTSRKPQLGDIIQAGFGALVSTYEAESEHIFIRGEPSKEVISYFNATFNAWKAGMEAAAPGKTCAEVNEAALNEIREAGYEQYLRHRMGHGKGLEEHEAPWVAEGDNTILLPGMIISDEPGLYIPGVGGFRYSDTLVITETGCRRLTNYPRNLESSVIL